MSLKRKGRYKTKRQLRKKGLMNRKGDIAVSNKACDRLNCSSSFKAPGTRLSADKKVKGKKILQGIATVALGTLGIGYGIHSEKNPDGSYKTNLGKKLFK